MSWDNTSELSASAFMITRVPAVVAGAVAPLNGIVIETMPIPIPAQAMITSQHCRTRVNGLVGQTTVDTHGRFFNVSTPPTRTAAISTIFFELGALKNP